MSITIQNVSGYPQPFLQEPEDLRHLLEVDEGLWTVCVAHVLIMYSTRIVAHLDSDMDNLILAKDIKIVFDGAWIVLTHQNGFLMVHLI